jgi:transcription termination factor Rho
MPLPGRQQLEIQPSVVLPIRQMRLSCSPHRPHEKDSTALSNVLNPLPPVETMELLLDKLGKTRSNGEFLGSMSG